MTSPAAPEDRSPILASVVVLTADILGHGAFAVHTILSRRRYGKLSAENLPDASLPIRLFVDTPTPIYAAAFVLFALALLVKEVFIERKELTLRLNLAALGLLVLLWAAWITGVSGPLDALQWAAP